MEGTDWEVWMVKEGSIARFSKLLNNASPPHLLCNGHSLLATDLRLVRGSPSSLDLIAAAARTMCLARSIFGCLYPLGNTSISSCLRTRGALLSDPADCVGTVPSLW
eukprot:TRINITY_DN1198_c0_g1_i11.p1 TRINITY_DN1198_c0_g1~~TRINITY_DN1198_c0_g1_i11.p1  ORF type:complete len:107 (-),score=0.92 TRINITY_DN1198_c0_g1_i11:191-511(-)